MLVHDVFHVCYLRGYKDDGHKAPPPVPDHELDGDHHLHLHLHEGEQNWEVDAVLDHKEFKQGRKHKLKYLLHFIGYGLEEDIWADDVFFLQRKCTAWLGQEVCDESSTC